MKRVKTPTVLQMEAVECGAASLGIILGYYGCFIPLEQLRIDCGVSRDGSKAINVVKVARNYGLKAEGQRVGIDDLSKLKMPVILFWGFSHFLVLEGIKNNQVYINDPATGPRTISPQELNEYFTGVVLTFEPTSTLQKKAKATTFFSTIKHPLRNCGKLLSFVFVAGLFLVIPNLIFPTFSKIFVDNILVKNMHSWLWPLLAIMLLIALIRGVLTWFQNLYLLKLEIKIAVSGAAKFFYHMLRLPIEFFSQRYPGDLVYRVELTDDVAQLFSSGLTSSLINFLMIIFFAILMFTYDKTLTLIGIASTLVAITILKLIYRRQTDLNRRIQTESGKTLGITMRGLQIIETVKAMGAENDFFTQLSGQLAKLINVQQKLGVQTNFLNTVYPFLALLTTTSVLIVGALRVIAGDISVGTLVAFQILMLLFLAPMAQIITLFQDMQKLQTDVEKLDDVFNYPRSSVFSDQENGKYRNARLSGNVVVQNITFGYNRLEKPLITDFNLHLTPGTRIALVGITGSGKSTLSKLIAGLYQPWTGEILFDGKKLSEISKDIFAGSVAMVDQDIFLFEGTIRDNITVLDETISEDDIVQAAKDAAIHDEIVAKMGGYAGKVEESGRNFSGGQRQRLEIARALVGNPAILILDEATSALDAYTEKLIDDNLRRRGCACLIIAHRLSTIRDCDEIIVLDKGVVVQRGKHEQLKNAPGLYAELIEMY
jgi:NHLM bacteriocin system ABC transporter peptidase/ATP-binding protein